MLLYIIIFNYKNILIIFLSIFKKTPFNKRVFKIQTYFAGVFLNASSRTLFKFS